MSSWTYGCNVCMDLIVLILWCEGGNPLNPEIHHGQKNYPNKLWWIQEIKAVRGSFKDSGDLRRNGLLVSVTAERAEKTKSTIIPCHTITHLSELGKFTGWFNTSWISGLEIYYNDMIWYQSLREAILMFWSIIIDYIYYYRMCASDKITASDGLPCYVLLLYVIQYISHKGKERKEIIEKWTIV